MSNFFDKAPASRLGRAIVTNLATAQVNASQTSTAMSAQTRQIRYVSNLATWVNVGSTTATAQSDTFVPANTVEHWICTPGQVVSFLSSSTSTGWVCITQMS
jgi:hypothetical protein